jgi:hypothetical protein
MRSLCGDKIWIEMAALSKVAASGFEKGHAKFGRTGSACDQVLRNLVYLSPSSLKLGESDAKFHGRVRSRIADCTCANRLADSRAIIESTC